MNIIGVCTNESTQVKTLELAAISNGKGFFSEISFSIQAVLGWVPPEAEAEMRI